MKLNAKYSRKLRSKYLLFCLLNFEIEGVKCVIVKGESNKERRGKRFPPISALFDMLVQRMEPLKQSNKKKSFIKIKYKEIKEER
jgi:hypothetical protein